MAPPGYVHQYLLGELHGIIHHYIKSKNGPCKVLPAPFAVFLNNDDKTYLEPDISVICDKSKLYKYNDAGVREYWIVDPQKNHIIVYNFADDDIMMYTFADTVKAGIYEDLYIDFSEFSLENN